MSAMRVITGDDGSDRGARKLQQLRDNANFVRRALVDMGCNVLGSYDSPVMVGARLLLDWTGALCKGCRCAPGHEQPCHHAFARPHMLDPAPAGCMQQARPHENLLFCLPATGSVHPYTAQKAMTMAMSWHCHFPWMFAQVQRAESCCVQPLMLFQPGKIAAFSRLCFERGIAVVVVGFPATPLLTARARLCMSAAHTREQLEWAVRVRMPHSNLTSGSYARNTWPVQVTMAQ